MIVQCNDCGALIDASYWWTHAYNHRRQAAARVEQTQNTYYGYPKELDDPLRHQPVFEKKLAAPGELTDKEKERLSKYATTTKDWQLFYGKES